jgi:hypothetical protein
LDPEQARRDLEPLNRSRGAMVKDALDEADIHLGQTAMPFDEKLRRLHALQKDGLISESEYQSAKQRLLADPR